jgi:prepilin-type processing-associated H-X9-DG protein/prepilin-type N-terminal cleavage/methylation domain-containing protein
LPLNGIKKKTGEDNKMFIKNKKAFSLVELLVVISIIALLLSVMIPVLGAARSQGHSAVCKSNIRQLVLANTGYATENNYFYVPAASDMGISLSSIIPSGGYHRWHGVRKSASEPFDPLKGPLAKYLADGKVKECPEKNDFVKDQTSFEKGCGGYGYNMTYIGSRFGQNGVDGNDMYELTANMSNVKEAAETLMFADCAFVNSRQNLIEYSFAEPPFTVWDGKPVTISYMLPSIHFRHKNKANIAWVDGHISLEVMTKFNKKNANITKSAKLMLGWFGPLDNSLFDLK